LALAMVAMLAGAPGIETSFPGWMSGGE